ncbi:unnamed protein product [Caenorhabditis angaria]|uniref:Serpentine receptor class r-10 n=1 Tax=Caenorhabditis angaria TaxID=860376 RepID=A0A9P1N9S7_9PELO|nr:unnamed protein product [Caenorhabditis angaria]
MLWNRAITQIQEISAVISILGKLLLILLIITKSPRQLGSYKYLMIYISTFEIIYSIVDVIVKPIIVSHDSIFICISKNFSLPKEISSYLILIWTGFFGSFLGFFEIQFIYRYLVACRSKVLNTFNDKRIFLWMMFPATVGIFWGSINNFFFRHNPRINRDIKSLVLEEYNWDIEKVVYIGENLYEPSENGGVQINKKCLIGIIIVWTIINISILTVSFFAIKCYLKIHSEFKGSIKLNHLQHQLFYALVTQTLIPFILMHLPASIIFFSTMFNLNLGNSSSIAAISFAIFPALDPLPVILIIKNYRNAVANVVTTRVLMISKKKP